MAWMLYPEAQWNVLALIFAEFHSREGKGAVFHHILLDLRAL